VRNRLSESRSTDPAPPPAARTAEPAQLADYAPAIVDLALTVIAIGAAIVAMVKCECQDCNGDGRG
jgi:hypothetical protein